MTLTLPPSAAATARLFLAGLAALVLIASARAETTTTLTWKDLVPPLSPGAQAFYSLTFEQQEDAGKLAELQRFEGHGIDVKAAGLSEESSAEIRARLEAQGLDVDDLLARYKVYKQEVTGNYTTVVEALDGKTVRIPGYALPLEFTGEAATEFLLVPYVGACIHVPAPPPNQIVFTEVAEPYTPTGLYDPVWVTGTLKVVGSQKNLSFVDGSAPINASYSLEAVRLEPYTE